nr:adhesion G protein-coupled receptor E3-like [Crassostrea gigas]
MEYGCYPGRVMKDGMCKTIIQFPVLMIYSLHILCNLRVSALTNDTSYVLSNVRQSVRRILVSSYIVHRSDIQVADIYFLPELPINIVHRDGSFFYELQVSLSYTLLYITRFNRDVVERELINTPQNIRMDHSINGSARISFSLEGFKFSNISKTLLSQNTMEKDYDMFKNYYKDALLNRPGIITVVSELLVCFHKFYELMEIEIDFNNYRVIVKETKEAFYIGDFIIDYKNRYRVCANIPPPSSLSSSLVESLNTLTTVLNIISCIFLVLLFVIYLLVRELRTVPGVNVMSSTFSLFCMQLTYTVSTVIRKGSLPCMITGVLLHYFWLCLCSCFFTCCFHMFISFRSLNTISQTQNQKQLLRYLMFSYGLPFIVVSLSAFISWYATGDTGYGTNFCFVEGLVQNIITFMIPIAITCIGNIILFVLTIFSINLNKNIQKSKKNKSELVIFFKLFFLTGSVWILQVIDSFLQLSFFSFFAAILTSSQGIFIFLSFATSSRILKYAGVLRKRTE